MISFLQPWVLLGLPLAALPLLFHLVQRRDPPSVVFPAVRYLRQVSEEHQRRLRIRHLLLLLVRTALILLLVLAAANPTARGGAPSSHTPAALVVVLDNSPSSGAIAGGSTVLAGLKTAARRVLERATGADAVWLMTAGGLARRGTPAELRTALDSVTPESQRLDLGEAVRQASVILEGERRPGGIVVLSDFQASALSAVRSPVPVTAARPAGSPPENAGIGMIEVGPQPWAAGGGTLVARLSGEHAVSVPVTVAIGGRFTRNTLATGGTATVAAGDLLPGWWVVAMTKAPDELRADDERFAVLRVVPAARARCTDLSRHVAVACQVLTESGRIRAGDDVALERLGRGASIVVPPGDPSGIGALNRALERRGSGWRFGAFTVAASSTDSSALVGRERVGRRYRLVASRAGLEAGVIATAGGEPWIVRSGELVLLGSRLEPDWTDLPLSPAFPGFVDALVNRVARGEGVTLEAAAGDAVPLPGQATALVRDGHRLQVEGGAVFRPPVPGVYFVMEHDDTIGSVVAGIDPRESALGRADKDQIEGLWPGARVIDLGEAADAAFTAVGRASLQTPVLWLALMLAAIELVLAAGGRRAS
ncbi:MAG: VWA domain-containing protein [Gemmatimonadales bacterium]|nr:MAG: VWA domain-containing protein [Gemmatimonadales bacterium]